MVNLVMTIHSLSSRVTGMQPGDFFVPSNDCLLRFLQDGRCFYDLSNPPVFFTLGGAIAAFGLIFAVYQLRRTEWEIVLDIRDKWQRNLFWWFGGMGLFLVLVRVILTQLPISKISLLTTPVSYELTAFIFFVLSPVSLLYFSTKKKNLYNTSTSRRFYYVMVDQISRSKEDNLSAALEILLHNFRDICKAAKTGDKESDYYQASIAILDVVLSDKSLVELLTTKRLDALLHILETIKEYDISKRESSVGVPKILNSLFYNQESFFYKQLDHDGLALSSSIYDCIFKNSKILNNFNVYGYPVFGYGAPEASPRSVRVLTDALSISIERYFMEGDLRVDRINEGLKILTSIFRDTCYKISIAEERKLYSRHNMSDERRILHDISYFFGHRYVFIAYDRDLKQSIVEHEKLARKTNLTSSEYLNEGIAGALYICLESLYYIEDTELVYRTVGDLLHGVVYEPEYKKGYAKPFEERLWKQVGHNVIGKFFPATLQPFLTMMSHYLSGEDTDGESWIAEQTKKTRRLLYVDLKPLLAAREKMVNDKLMEKELLPSWMEYDTETDSFFVTLRFGRGERTRVTEPQENTSSLQDYDPGDRVDFDGI